MSHTFTATHECEDGSFDTVSCGGTCSATATLFADGSMQYSGFGNATDGCGRCEPECGGTVSGTHSNGTWSMSAFGVLDANGTYDENNFTGSGGRISSGGNEPTLTWEWSLSR